MKDIIELIVSIAVSAIPIIGAFVSKKIISNKKAVSLLQAIEPLAQAAVVASEQMGVTEQLTGAMKKSEAVKSVSDGLASIGFKKTDEALIANAVEKAYAEIKDQIHAAYGVQITSTTTTTLPEVTSTTTTTSAPTTTTTTTTTTTQAPVETSTTTTTVA